MQNIKARTILGYDDVAACAPGESNEPLVDIRAYDSAILTQYYKDDMKPFTGDAMYLRKEVAQKLALIDSHLADQQLSLKVVYGYRHPKIQEKYFARRRGELAKEFPKLSPGELDRFTHAFVAIPDVAGHPTGGAVDLTLVGSDGKPLDMGTPIADYSDYDAIKTHSSKVGPSQMTNRLLLHDEMVRQGFAPFYGEWWHFSYGDREWAAFYDRKKALYGAVDFKI